MKRFTVKFFIEDGVWSETECDEMPKIDQVAMIVTLNRPVSREAVEAALEAEKQ